MPTIVKVNKYQIPLLFISCNLLIDTEISGIRRNKLKVKLSPENKTVSRNVSDKNNNTLNNCQCQNSALEDLPSKSKYLTRSAKKIKLPFNTPMIIGHSLVNLFDNWLANSLIRLSILYLER